MPYMRKKPCDHEMMAASNICRFCRMTAQSILEQQAGGGTGGADGPTPLRPGVSLSARADTTSILKGYYPTGIADQLKPAEYFCNCKTLLNGHHNGCPVLNKGE